MKISKEHSWFIAAFTFTVAVFLYPLILMKASFLYGDNFVQFYPWLKCYSEALKNFSFPFWIRQMGAGFPLMAEGQVGGFYPLNIVVFFLLPFNIAYNCSIVSHFIMGGIFAYLYTRRIGADQRGGYVAALLFCFGSAYAGCFYNIVTLRTLAWFPLVLLLLEYYFERKYFKYIFLCGIVLGLQFLAGFIQMAAYSAVFYSAYFVYRSYTDRIDFIKSAKSAAIFFITALIIALPQLILTFQLASLSGREHATLGFALWRSFLPYGLLGSVFPYSLSSASAHFYIGILSLLFVIFSFTMAKNSPSLKAIILMLFLSLFFAVGWLNPLYVAFLKVTKLYFFRNPSKFLFFGVFALSVLAGYGFTKFFEPGNGRQREKAIRVFRFLIIGAVALFSAIKILSILFKYRVLELGHYLVKNFVYNMPHHRYPLYYYINKSDLWYENFINNMCLSNVLVISSLFFVAIAALIPIFLHNKRIRSICLAAIFADLFVFSFYGIGFRSNMKPFEVLRPDAPNILEIVKNNDKPCRVFPFDIKSEKLPNWSIPNANIMYGVDSIACYTPLVEKAYKKILSGLEVVDDSLGLDTPHRESILQNISLLKRLNVKYIISPVSLGESALKQVVHEKSVFLYELEDTYPRVFFSINIQGAVRPHVTGELRVNVYKDGLVDLELTNDRSGYVVFSENYYPGWHAYVDGKENSITEVDGLMQAVPIKEGSHKIRFVYKPYSMVFRR